MKKLLKILGVVLAMVMCFSMVACGGNDKKDTNMKYMHISMDDSIACFENLATKKPTSLFDEPFFKELKDLHDEYGATFSLYSYNSVLKKVDDSYVEEFKANADWLKIGLHANSAPIDRSIHENSINNAGYEGGKKHWNSFVENVKRICGSTDSIDVMPRLEFYFSTLDYVKGFKDAEFGAQGFLARGDGKECYYINKEVAEYIKTNNFVKDTTNNLTIVATDLTIEEVSPYPAKTEFPTMTDERIAEIMPSIRLNEKLKDENFAKGPAIIYSHEYCFYTGEGIFKTITWLEDCCKWAKDNGYSFGFSQNKAFADNSQTLSFE